MCRDWFCVYYYTVSSKPCQNRKNAAAWALWDSPHIVACVDTLSRTACRLLMCLPVWFALSLLALYCLSIWDAVSIFASRMVLRMCILFLPVPVHAILKIRHVTLCAYCRRDLKFTEQTRVAFEHAVKCAEMCGVGKTTVLVQQSGDEGWNLRSWSAPLLSFFGSNCEADCCLCIVNGCVVVPEDQNAASYRECG